MYAMRGSYRSHHSPKLVAMFMLNHWLVSYDGKKDLLSVPGGSTTALKNL